RFVGSAFALVRPMFEAVVRAHVAVKGTENDVQRLWNDQYRMDFNQIGGHIDNLFDLDGLLQRFINETLPILHSCTHSGLFQVERRFKGDSIEPNYPDMEIIQLIRIFNSGAFMLTLLVTHRFGFEAEWRKAHDLFLVWSSKRQENR